MEREYNIIQIKVPEMLNKGVYNVYYFVKVMQDIGGAIMCQISEYVSNAMKLLDVEDVRRVDGLIGFVKSCFPENVVVSLIPLDKRHFTEEEDALYGEYIIERIKKDIEREDLIKEYEEYASYVYAYNVYDPEQIHREAIGYADMVMDPNSYFNKMCELHDEHLAKGLIDN